MDKHFDLLAIITALIVGCLVIAGQAMASDFARGPHPDSFRGILWGAPLSEAPKLKAVTKPGYHDTYYRTDENLTLLDADILSISYYFHKDRFYRAGVAFKGETNLFLIKSKLMELYGPGMLRGSSHGWTWPDFSIEVKYDKTSDRGELYYTLEALPSD